MTNNMKLIIENVISNLDQITIITNPKDWKDKAKENYDYVGANIKIYLPGEPNTESMHWEFSKEVDRIATDVMMSLSTANSQQVVQNAITSAKNALSTYMANNP